MFQLAGEIVNEGGAVAVTVSCAGVAAE